MKNKKIFVYVLAALVGLWAGYFAASAVFGAAPDTAATVTSGAKEDGTDLTAARPEEHPAYEYAPDVKLDMDVLTANWYPDCENVYKCLVYAKKAAVKREAESAYSEVEEAVVSLGSFSKYLKYRDTLSITVGDTVYGAYVGEGDSPIGGGKGYKDIFTTGDHIVKNYRELKEACEKAKEGEVIFIPSGVTIDLTMETKADENLNVYITLNKGVILASDRGYVREDGSVSTGAKICGYRFGKDTTSSGFVYCKSDVRITGLVFEGPDPNRHLEHHYRSFSVTDAPGHSYYYTLPMASGIGVYGENVEIDNCEISGFSSVAIGVNKREVHVHHNYIHHNQINGLGYGVCFGGGGLVEYNLFNFNRHSIAGSGKSDQYYVARYNVDMGDSLDHVFDMHGGADRKDGTNIAGKYIEMYNNTFLADMLPYYRRGVPTDYQIFYHNVVKNPKSFYNFDRLRGEKMELYDNIFGIEKKTVLK